MGIKLWDWMHDKPPQDKNLKTRGVAVLEEKREINTWRCPKLGVLVHFCRIPPESCDCAARRAHDGGMG
jgi:hypothetical protein